MVTLATVVKVVATAVLDHGLGPVVDDVCAAWGRGAVATCVVQCAPMVEGCPASKQRHGYSTLLAELRHQRMAPGCGSVVGPRGLSVCASA